MVGITEQKLKNKRFRKTEEKIISALLLSRDDLSMNNFLKTAEVSRSTIYRHHRNFYNISKNYENYLLRKFRRFLKALVKNKITLAKVYTRILIFLIPNQKIILLILSRGNRKFIETLLSELRVIVMKKVKNDKIFKIYLKEVSGVIEEWIYDGFNQKKIEEVVNQISYLTETAWSRLGPLASS